MKYQWILNCKIHTSASNKSSFTASGTESERRGGASGSESARRWGVAVHIQTLLSINSGSQLFPPLHNCLIITFI